MVILACNTPSAKPLRTIQQNDLPKMDAGKRVLGVIRPTTEVIGTYSETGSVGILATNGTVSSESYPIEIRKFYPELKVYQEACPMWVPLVENNEHQGNGADFFIKKNLHNIFAKGETIDVLLTVEHLTAKGVSIISKREGFDLSTPMGKAMLTMLAAVAELERSNIKARQMAGIERAKAEGKALGRSKVIDDADVRQWRSEHDASIKATAEHFCISPASVKRACKIVT